MLPRARYLVLAVIGGVAGPAAWGQFPSELVGFNGPPIDEPTAHEMFRIPETSGSTREFIQLNDPNNPFGNNNAFRASGLQTEGDAALQAFFRWVDNTDTNRWVRLTTFNGVERPNPSLHLGGKVRFKITNQSELFRGSVGICIGIRETGTNVPQLADGGTVGDIEWVGATGVVTDPNTADPIRPIPAVTLAPSGTAVTLEFDLATGTVKRNGVSQGGGIHAFTGDGVLSAPNDRGTLEHIAIVGVAGDTAVQILFAIDELQFEAPVADPVLPPTVVSPIIAGDTLVTVTDLQFNVNQVNLLRGHTVVLTQSVASTDPVVFDLTAPGGGGPAVTGEVFTATQRVGTTTSAESPPVTVFPEAPRYAMSFVLDEDGDGSCSFNPPGGWEFVGVTNLTGLAGGDLFPEGTAVFVNNAVWQTIDFPLNDPAIVTAWLGGNGTVDPSPTGRYSIDSIWFNIGTSGHLGPHEVLIDAVETLDDMGNVIDVIHTFEDGIAYMQFARGQSTVDPTSSGLSALGSFDGTSAHRATWSYPDATQEALGLYHNIGFSCGTAPDFSSDAVTVRFRIHARSAPDPNLPPPPSVVGPIVGAQSSVRVNNDAAATSLQLYVNGSAVGSPVVPSGTQTDFTGVSLNLGDSVSAKQIVGGEESDFAYPRGVARPIPPTIATPVSPGSTAVTVNGVLAAPFAMASLVTVNVNNGEEIATAVPSGTSVVVNLTGTLSTGDVLFATQTVNGSESRPSVSVTVAFPKPVIYKAPAEADTSIRVQALVAQTDLAKVQVFDPGDPNNITEFSTAVTPGSTFADVPVTGLLAGLNVVAIQSAGGVDSVPSDREVVTIGTRTTVFCDSFEYDEATYTATWSNSGANPRPTLVSDRNATPGGAKSLFGAAGTTHRVERNLANLLPTPTQPVIFNINIYDSSGAGVASSNIWAQLNGQTADFFFMHIGLSGPTIQPQLDTDVYQFRAVGNGGPDWINLVDYDAPTRTRGWHTFTVVHKRDFIDVYVDGLLSAKNIPLIAATTFDKMRIGPGLNTAISGHYDDYCVEVGRVRFGEITPQPPNEPRVAAPIQDGDTSVTVAAVDPDVTLVEIVDQSLSVIGSASGPPDMNGEIDVTLNRALVHLERITAEVTNANGTTSSAPLEVGIGNGDVLIAIGVRETGDTGPLGSPGGSTGTIEWIGVTGTTNGAPQGQPISPSGSWQTITFDPAGSVFGFTGNGVIDGTRGTLEHLAVAVNAASPDRSAGAYELYVDNVVNVGAGSGGSDFVIENFEGLTLGTEALFQEPTNSGSTAAHMTPLPSASEVSDAFGNPGQSELLVWYFVDTSAQRWARITTFGVAQRPSPIIDLTKPIRMDVLLVEEVLCPGDATGDNQVTLEDLAVLLSNYGTTSGATVEDGDFTGDGAVTLEDLAILLSNFGTICS